jgi:predicted transcriptional regulator
MVLLRCNLNLAAFRRFTGELESAGLLRRVFEGGRKWFVTTEYGWEFVGRFERLMQMVEAAAE